jgi:hypothetical protein
MVVPSRALGLECDVLTVLQSPPRVDELDHHPRLIFGQWTWTLEKLEIQIDSILLDVQPPATGFFWCHALNLAGNGTGALALGRLSPTISGFAQSLRGA